MMMNADSLICDGPAASRQSQTTAVRYNAPGGILVAVDLRLSLNPECVDTAALAAVDVRSSVASIARTY